MHPAKAARDNMVNGELGTILAAVLAGVIVAPQDFAPAQLDFPARSFNHPFQPDDRWAREFQRHGTDMAATIQHQAHFAGHHQADGAPHIADIKRLEIRIKYQNWFLHHHSVTLRIIARVAAQGN